MALRGIGSKVLAITIAFLFFHSGSALAQMTDCSKALIPATIRTSVSGV